MRFSLSAVTVLLLLVATSSSWTDGISAFARKAEPETPDRRAALADAVAAPVRPREMRRIASLPDRGQLAAFRRDVAPRRTRAYTWHAINLSERHARAAIHGELVVTDPNGEQIRLRYVRHVEHADGNWTWVGRPKDAQPGTEAIITFGARAVFGTIPSGTGSPLRITTGGGHTWMMDTDDKVVTTLPAAHPTSADALLPPIRNPKPTSGSPTAASLGAEAISGSSATVDLLIGYTSGFAARLGGDSQATTRLENLVDITNQAYSNSQIEGRVRLLKAIRVNYPDATANSAALYALTGCTETACTQVDPALQPLHAAREQYGADAISLVRNYHQSENGGCGIAWLIGGGQRPISSSDEYAAMSVVSDTNGMGGPGSFPDNGYVCRDESLAHELGHNMGSAHDVATADGDDNVLQANEYGRYAYSFGYRTGLTAGNFYTVMAYGDGGQARYRVFSNPRISVCGGFPCGQQGQADNSLSISQTLPTIAAFRSGKKDLYAISKKGASETTEIHILSQASVYREFTLHRASALARTGADYGWRFLLGDYNRDGLPDLYVIAKMGASGTTEVHVLDGATLFSTYLLHTTTALHQTGTDNGWTFGLGDYNHDGVLDLWAITRNGASGTEIHILDGSDRFATYLVHSATPVQSTGADGAWHFMLGDYNNDGVLDVYMVVKAGTSSGATEIHVLDGVGFKTFLLHVATALHTTGVDNAWDFELVDYDGDGVQDVVGISKNGLSGSTELHVLDGAQRFAAFDAHIATSLLQTGSDDSFEFEFGNFH